MNFRKSILGLLIVLGSFLFITLQTYAIECDSSNKNDCDVKGTFCDASLLGKVEKVCSPKKSLNKVSNVVQATGGLGTVIMYNQGPSESAADLAEDMGDVNAGLAVANFGIGTACYTLTTTCSLSCGRRKRTCKALEKFEKEGKLYRRNIVKTDVVHTERLQRYINSCHGKEVSTFESNVENIVTANEKIASLKKDLSTCTPSPPIICTNIQTNIDKEKKIIQQNIEIIQKGVEQTILDDIEKTKTGCDKQDEHAVAALGQATQSALIAMSNYATERQLRPEEEKPDAELAPRPISMDRGMGSEVNYNAPGRGQGSNADLAGGDNDDDGGAGTAPPAPSGGDEDKKDKDDDETNGDRSGSFAGGDASDALPSANQDKDKKDKKSLFPLGRPYPRVGGFVGGTGGSNYGRNSNRKNRQSRGGSKSIKVASNKKFSNSPLKRMLSSQSAKHKSIFEYMTTLIKSYCSEGSKNCR